MYNDTMHDLELSPLSYPAIMNEIVDYSYNKIAQIITRLSQFFDDIED